MSAMSEDSSTRLPDLTSASNCALVCTVTIRRCQDGVVGENPAKACGVPLEESGGGLPFEFHQRLLDVAGGGGCGWFLFTVGCLGGGERCPGNDEGDKDVRDLHDLDSFCAEWLGPNGSPSKQCSVTPIDLVVLAVA